MRTGTVDTDWAIEDLLLDFSKNPEELFLRDAVWDAIQATLEELPTLHRQAWVWHELDGLSFRQMAERGGTKQPGSSTAWLQRRAPR